MQRETQADQAILDLLAEEMRKYGFDKKPLSQIDPTHLEELFELALDVLGGHKETMRMMPQEKKFFLIKQITEKKSLSPTKEKGKRPYYYVDLLNIVLSNSHSSSNTMKVKAEQIMDLFHRQFGGGQAKQTLSLKEILSELKIQCQTQTKSWLKEFMSCGGLANLFAVLKSMHAKPGRRAKHYEIESETLKILKTIANHDSGITDILCHQNFLNILILSLDSPLLVARTATLDFLLAIITVEYPTGHKLVISALEHFRTTRGHHRVFDFLVDSIAKAASSRGIFGSKVGAVPSEYQVFGFGSNNKDLNKHPTEKDIRDFLVSGVALVRFLVEIPPEFEYRMHLRHELISSKINQVFQKLTTFASSEYHDVLQHVVAFENLKSADFKYLLCNMDSELDIDVDDPNALLGLLNSKLGENDSRTITSLIQNIVVGTSLIDADARSYMLSMIEKAVTFIVLDQNGITNFTDAFKYSVDQIITQLQEIEQLREENIQLSALCDHQEKQMMDLRGKTEAPEKVRDILILDGKSKISVELLEAHKKRLETIFNAINSKSIGFSAQKNTEALKPKEEQNSIPSIPIPPPPPPGPISINNKPPPPPPPLPITNGGPPPPPPPPGAGPAPPPPPGAPPQILSAPVKYKPTTNVRKLHWENISPVSFETSIWSKLSPSHSDLEELLFKAGLLTEIDAAFQLKEVKPIRNSTSSIATAVSSFNVLPEKRAQNVMIFLGTLRQISVEDLVKYIRTFDSSKLTESILKQCKNSLPTVEEVKLLHGMESGASNLRSAEKFMLLMCEMHRYRNRVNILIFKFGFFEHFQQLKLQLFSFLGAFKCITKSSKFQKLLQLILIVGNYMNASSNRSIAGFKVSFLEKIIDLKGTNGAPALQVISKIVRESQPEIVDCLKDLAPVRNLRNVSFKALQDDIAEIQGQFNTVHKEIEMINLYQENPLYQAELDDVFIEKLKEFHSEASTKVKFLNQEYEGLQAEVKKVFDFFAEPISPKMTPETIIGYIAKFLNAFENAYKESEKKEKLMQKQAEKRKVQESTPAKTEKLASAPLKSAEQSSSEESSSGKIEGQLDSLLENLKKRPALQSFDPMQRSKQSYDLGKRYPRAIGNQGNARKPTPTAQTSSSIGLLSNSSVRQQDIVNQQAQERKSSANKVADSAWKLLEQIDFNTDLTFDFD